MSKTSNTLMMLQILNARNIVKVSELAEALETNPRNIIEYKKELEYCGYYIESIPGKYGGYRLDKERILPSINLNEEDKNVLAAGTNYLMSRDDFLLKEPYNVVLGKIYSSVKARDYYNNYKVISRFPLALGEAELNIRFKVLQSCILTHKKISLLYRTQKNKELTYIYHPYDLFMYNNSWYVIGWNELYGCIIFLKLNRIISFFKMEETFTMWKYYDLNNYVDEYGFKSTRNWYYVKFKAKGKLAAIVKDRLYGRNQKLEEIDNENTIISAEMENKESALSFIMAHFNQIEVLEPNELRQEIVKVAEDLQQTYKEGEI